MKRQIAICLILGFALLIAPIAAAYAQDWELIAQTNLPMKANQEFIPVASLEAGVAELQFGVQNGPIKIYRIIAHAADGATFPIRIDGYIDPGEVTPPVSISETGVALTEVELFYYTKKHVVIEVYGKSPSKGSYH